MTALCPAPADAPPPLVFAPVGIAHLTTDTADLLRHAAAGRSRLRITTAAQLNGKPHIGTVVTVLTVFAVAAHAADVLGLQVNVVFDGLENAPAETVLIDGEPYTRNVEDLIDSGHLDPAERADGFLCLLTWAASRSGVPWEYRPYRAYQALRPVREALHRIAARLDDFRPIVAPADGIVRVRPRCPHCRLMEKTARSLRITALDGAIRLDSSCPKHGRYAEVVAVNGHDGWYDANTPVRSIQKGYLLWREADAYDAVSVSVDGADWGGAWHAHILAPALSAFGVPVRRWPTSIFTPLVLDQSGGKLSKTLYVRHRAYGGLPPMYLDLDVLLNTCGDAALEVLWAETCRWAAEPRRLHRSYTIDHIRGLLRAARLDVGHWSSPSTPTGSRPC